MTDTRLEFARRLHALARTGLHFCGNEYDRQRYEEIERIAEVPERSGDERLHVVVTDERVERCPPTS